jgi:hypothetical protein
VLLVIRIRGPSSLLRISCRAWTDSSWGFCFWRLNGRLCLVLQVLVFVLITKHILNQFNWMSCGFYWGLRKCVWIAIKSGCNCLPYT